MNKLIIIVTFVWAGFVSSISFMEAWLKFQAPNITRELGLGIGKLVFNALNNVEIVFGIIMTIIVALVTIEKKKFEFSYTFFVFIVILLLQTFWLTPELIDMATKIIQGIDVPKSKLHFLFIILEVIKVVCLIIFGMKLLNAEANRTKS